MDLQANDKRNIESYKIIYIKHIYFNTKIKLVERIVNYLIIFTRQAANENNEKSYQKDTKKKEQKQFNNYFKFIIFYG